MDTSLNFHPTSLALDKYPNIIYSKEQTVGIHNSHSRRRCSAPPGKESYSSKLAKTGSSTAERHSVKAKKKRGFSRQAKSVDQKVMQKRDQYLASTAEHPTLCRSRKRGSPTSWPHSGWALAQTQGPATSWGLSDLDRCKV